MTERELHDDGHVGTSEDSMPDPVLTLGERLRKTGVEFTIRRMHGVDGWSACLNFTREHIAVSGHGRNIEEACRRLEYHLEEAVHG